MNKVLLIGRVVRDGELKYTPGAGTPVMSFTLAVENYNSKTKEKGADFIPVVLWGKSAENLAQYLLKGVQVAVSGRISVRTYDAKDGSKRYVTEVIADGFGGVKLLGSKKKEDVFDKNFNEMAQEQWQEEPMDDGSLPF